MSIFRIGRLEFCFGEARMDHLPVGLQKGAPIVEMHIPQDGALDYDACRASVRQAVAFFC